MVIANAAGLESNLELTLPLVVISLILLWIWDDIVRTLRLRVEEDAAVDEFPEDKTAEEWLDFRFPKRPDLARSTGDAAVTVRLPNAAGGTVTPTREAVQTTKGMRSSAT